MSPGVCVHVNKHISIWNTNMCKYIDTYIYIYIYIYIYMQDTAGEAETGS